MSEVLAGAMAGVVMSLYCLGLGALALPRLSRGVVYRRLLPPGTQLTLLFLLIAVAVPPLWLLLGTMSGLGYKIAAASFVGSGLGSPNIVYTVGTVGVAAALCLLLSLLGRSAFRYWLALSLGIAATFGWLLPWLAQ